MKQLEERIRKEGKVLSPKVLKIDRFLNHMVDPFLMAAIGKEIAGHFAGKGITKVLTLEASGIPPAFCAARELGVPMVFAKKAGSSNIGADIYRTSVHSFTYNRDFEICVYKNYLTREDIVLIVDDFLSDGCACQGLADLCEQAGAKVAGYGICVEKGFEQGGKKLRDQGADLFSLAIVESMQEGEIVFRPQP